jgi:hypothetical protein
MNIPTPHELKIKEDEANRIIEAKVVDEFMKWFEPHIPKLTSLGIKLIADRPYSTEEITFIQRFLIKKGWHVEYVDNAITLLPGEIKSRKM